MIKSSFKADIEGVEPPAIEEEEEEGEKMQANPAYLPIEMSYKSQESKYINVSSWSIYIRSVHSAMTCIVCEQYTYIYTVGVNSYKYTYIDMWTI